MICQVYYYSLVVGSLVIWDDKLVVTFFQCDRWFLHGFSWFELNNLVLRAQLLSANFSIVYHCYFVQLKTEILPKKPSAILSEIGTDIAGNSGATEINLVNILNDIITNFSQGASWNNFKKC